MKTLKQYIFENQFSDTMDRLKKSGGKVFKEKAVNKKTKEVATLAQNGNIYFLITPDGKFTRANQLKKVLGKDWEVQRDKNKLTDINYIANQLQAGQNDGDVVDRLMNMGVSLKNINKAAKSLGAKNVNDFLEL